MKKNELLKELVNIKDLLIEQKYFKQWDIVAEKMVDLIEKLKREKIYWNNYKINKTRIRKKSQAGQILEFLQHHEHREVSWVDFMKDNWLSKAPFIWYSATARLSELKRFWLVEIVWKQKWVKRFFYKSKDRNLYKITEKGLKYKLK